MVNMGESGRETSISVRTGVIRCAMGRFSLFLFLIAAAGFSSVICISAVADTNSSNVTPSVQGSGTTQNDTFDSGKNLRDPFSPVGYWRPANQKGKASKRPLDADERKKALSKLRVGAIVKCGQKCYASINGLMVQEGDVIAAVLGDNVLKWRIRSIDINGVRIEPVEK